MYRNIIIVLFTFLALKLTCINARGPIVETTHGKVEGKVVKTLLKNVKYHAYMGIPYAAPPIKDLRFLAPQPINPWNDVLVATKEKKACIQFNNNIRKGQPFGVFGVEDCLYLDIFSPKTDGTLYPVIVFLYNENFSGSYNKTKDYSPDFFIEEDVVVVTLSHRLSVIGFLSLDDEIVPGNSGLKDIVAALEWTKNNIVKFGGNPDRITLMGSLGGATAIDLLINSNAKHLFHSAILQSGTSWASTYLQENLRERAYKLAEVLERSSSSNGKLLKELNDLPASDLLSKELRAAPDDYFKEEQRGTISFAPIVEKDPNGLITKYPEDSEDGINIPIMIGFNSREGIDASIHYLEEPRFLSFVQKDFPFFIPIRAKFKFNPNDEICYEAINEIKDLYYKKGKVTIKSIAEHITYLGDVLTAYPVDYTARVYSQRSSKSLYYYYFDYFSDLNENKNNLMKISKVAEGTWGASSGDELCYLFYCPDLKKNYVKHNKTLSEEIKLQKIMVKLWTNFAKYGNPTPDGDAASKELKWPTYNSESKNYLHITKIIEVKSDLYKERFEFWDNFLKKWKQKAVNGVIGKLSNIRNEL